MSEFFIELFSEEIPAGLQRNSRNVLLENFQNLFEEKKILFKKSSSFSTPNRLIILFEGLSKEITQKAEEIKGPNVNAPEKAIEGFLRSNQIDKKNLLKKINELKKYFSSINKDENYKVSLDNLANSKKVIFEFFDNVKVNDQEENIKKNRLELLQMLCRTFNNYINFSNLEVK